MLKVKMITNKLHGTKVRIINDKTGTLIFDGGVLELSGNILDREVVSLLVTGQALEIYVED